MSDVEPELPELPDPSETMTDEEIAALAAEEDAAMATFLAELADPEAPIADEVATDLGQGD